MPAYNSVTLLGNVTKDPEIRYTPKGAAVCDLSLAINRTYTADNGEKREEVTFVDCTAWAKTAELIGQYVKKGNPLFVTGRLQTDTWEDKQSGQKRSKLKVVIENVQFLGSREGNGGSGGDTGGGSTARAQSRPSSSAPAQRAVPRQQATASAGGDMESDDIPFASVDPRGMP